jgi:hypothetical protein
MSPLDDLLNSVPPPADPKPTPSANEPLESGSIFDVALHSRSKPGAGKARLSQGEVASLAESLVEGYLQYFASADASIRWLDVEREYAIWLDERTLLVGRIDAVGATEDEEKFFLELKTSKPPWKTRREEWKLKWLMSPQSLTYGVIAETAYPGMRRFTVRMAYKSLPPTYDYEWFRFGGAEIEWWRGELINIADEIRSRRHGGVKAIPWSPNMPEACFKYGPEYVCPRFHPACSKLLWNAEIPGSVPREPHLEVERKFLSENVGSFGQPMRKGVVVLDATRVEKWMGCRERYRGEYELGVREPGGDALEVGIDFHSMIKQHHLRLMKRT